MEVEEEKEKMDEGKEVHKVIHLCLEISVSLFLFLHSGVKSLTCREPRRWKCIIGADVFQDFLFY